MEEATFLWGETSRGKISLGQERFRPFAYDYVATLFNVFPPKVRKEIQVLKSRDEGGHLDIIMIQTWWANI